MVKELLQKAEKYFYKSQYQAALNALQEAGQAAQKVEDWESYVQAQNDLGAILNHLSKYQEALPHLHKAIKAGEKYLSENHLIVAETYNILGCVYTHENQYEQSEKYFSKAIHLYQKSPQHLRELANAYNNTGWFFSEMGKYTQSLHYHQLALEIRLALVKERPHEVAQSYNNIGACYMFTGDTNKALIYYQKALHIWQEVYGNQHVQTAIAYNNIGWGYSQQAELNTAIQYYQKALEIRSTILGEKHLSVAQSRENIAYCLMELRQFDKALEYYQNAFDIRNTLVPENHPTLIKIYRNLGACYLEMEEFEASFQFLNKALQIFLQTPQQETTEKIILYNKLGDYYEKTLQYSKAIEAYHQVLCSAIPNYHTNNPYEAPAALGKYQNGLRLGYAIHHKAKAFLEDYLQNQGLKELEAALSHYKKAVEVLNENRQGYTTTASKLNHAKLVIHTYEGAIHSAYLSYQATQNKEDFYAAFSFAELSKSYVLLSKIKESEAKISAHIPAEILQKEQNLQIEIASLDKRIQQLKLKIQSQTPTTEGNERMRYLQGKYFDISLQYDQVIKEIELNYPQYYQLKYDLKTAHPTNIQAQLSPQQVLINYFVGSQYLFIFAISKDQFHFLHLPKPEDLADNIEYVHDAIGMGDEDDLQDLGEQLFEQLLAPILAKEPNCKQLIFIPDDCLHRLPFDILWVEDGRWTTNGGRQTADEGAENAGIHNSARISNHENYQETSKKPQETIRNNQETPRNHQETIRNPQKPPETPKKPQETIRNNQRCYLIENFQISYHYSATLWLESQKKQAEKGKQANSFLGVAPIRFESVKVENSEDSLTAIDNSNKKITFKSDFDSDGKLKELSDSKDEIQHILELFVEHQFPATALLYQQATKENFLQQLQGKKYIVLSSHGFYNEQNPSLSGIYFANSPTVSSIQTTSFSSSEESKLYISDTFHLPLDADLVVLSSCESGIGELQKGEGMLALNRGFLYAGASNIIYSLFKVPDASSQLTPSFFRYVLQENCSYAAALQKAKLNLIEARQEPLYWAGFALVGR